MKTNNAITHLNPQKWADTSPAERLALLEAVRENLKKFGGELAVSDTAMKNDQMGEEIYTDPLSMIATIVPMANTVSAAIDVYEGIVHGKMPEPISITKVGNDRYDIAVFPIDTKDKLMNGDRKDFIRVKGEPKQVNPMDKSAGITAVLGAGNYSSSLEMLKAIFFDNKVVVHKPHHLNADSDKVWEKVMAPLIDHQALAFADHDQGRVLTTDTRIDKIYFTGGAGTAKAIQSATQAELISECGGNNPVIIVPGDRPWTDKEIAHQAHQIVTINKLNGGAVCGRVQTLVTSKHWAQRDQFLDAIRKAIVEDTPAEGTYYPGAGEVKDGFLNAYPQAERLSPEGGLFKAAENLLITGIEVDSYGTRNEAFCQITGEVPLDVPANATEFLPAAVAFCNEKLLGTLGSAILIDEDTKKTHQAALDRAITDMEYGAIAVNAMPPFIFLSPWLTWGGNEEGKEFVSGVGNFGNAMCFENVEKSILTAGFMSPGHMIKTNKGAFDTLATEMANYAVEPSWRNLTCLMGGAIMGGFRRKDF